MLESSGHCSTKFESTEGHLNLWTESTLGIEYVPPVTLNSMAHLGALTARSDDMRFGSAKFVCYNMSQMGSFNQQVRRT